MYMVLVLFIVNFCGWYSLLNGNIVVLVDLVVNLIIWLYMFLLVMYMLLVLFIVILFGERWKLMLVNGNMVCLDVCVGDYEGCKIR